jgi:hypothetical protein
MDYQSQENGSMETLNAAAKLFELHPKVLEKNEKKALQQYMKAREGLIAAMQQRGPRGLREKGNEDLEYKWDSFVQELLKFSPGFEQIYNRSLERDTLTLGVSK